jgi:hypothetical protein
MGFLVSFPLAAETLQPTKTINLDSLKLPTSKCGTKSEEGVTQMFWVDDDHVAVNLWAAPCPGDPPSAKLAEEVVVFDRAGSIQATAQVNDLISIARGPRGTIAGSASGKLVLFDAQVHSKETLDCPHGSQACGITLSPDRGPNSKFAVCSFLNAQQFCDFYDGWPTKKLSSAPVEATGSEDPYTHLLNDGFHPAWRVGADEIWSFSDGRLMRSGDGKGKSFVSDEDYVGKNGGGCIGTQTGCSTRYLDSAE